MATSPELEQKIKEETAKVKVDSYQSIASRGGWSGGGRTLWAVAAVAAAIGGMIGVVAPFFPLLVGASSFATAVSAIPASVAAFAATGLSSGFAGGLMLGRISGVGAAVGEEQERRMKEWMVRQKIHSDPESHIIPDAPKEKPQPKTFRQRMSDSYHTYINPRIGLLFAGLGAIGGMIMGAAFVATGGAGGFAIMPAIGALTGLSEAAAAAPAVVMAYTIGVSASIGALWSFNLPKIVSAVTHFSGELMSGRLLGREWKPKEPKNSVEKAAVPEKAPPAPVITAPYPAVESESSPRLTVRQFASYTEMVAQQAAEPSAEMLAKR